MGRFTEDMGRLRDEIESERMARQTLIADTRQEVTDAAHAFISNLKSSVETLQTNFRETHADMAQAARADRNAFLAQLGGTVADLQRQTVTLVNDLAGERSAGRQAWRGAASTSAAPPAARAKSDTAPKTWHQPPAQHKAPVKGAGRAPKGV
ncbi:hypothetical protein [uncultured Thiodictyon sp.]|jgi:hypothetical protein|uniref:hypothetical protein n=1 Tax=uncultured Thiodictyon sp. TaxID=1846217 RepID=UPI0025E72151|nr:hypothetical protein [uncultured Thiodictyon sp.]